MNELELLKPVSRSFYISIRLLPRPLRQPVALAYLLARTSDTIADSSAVNVEKRIELLDRFARAVARKEEDLGEDEEDEEEDEDFDELDEDDDELDEDEEEEEEDEEDEEDDDYEDDDYDDDEEEDFDDDE